MSKSAKIWLITAAFLVTIGAILFAAVMTAYHWGFSRLSTDRFETNTYEISEEFSNIQLSTGTADLLFAASSDNKGRVVCHEEENMTHSVGVQDDTLIIRAADNRKWYEHIGFSFDSPQITVYLPKTEYASLVIKESTGDIEIPTGFRFDEADISLSTGDVRFSASVRGQAKIETGTGDIRVNNATIETLDLSVSTGRVTVADVACQNLLTTGSTGDISLRNVMAAGRFSIERSTGEVSFDRSDAAEIFVKTSTGDVTGSLLTDKVFVTETATGNISVPETTAGGRCEITTSTGDIKMSISGGGK